MAALTDSNREGAGNKPMEPLRMWRIKSGSGMTNSQFPEGSSCLVVVPVAPMVDCLPPQPTRAVLANSRRISHRFFILFFFSLVTT
jgi:hypothetical protein